MTRTLVNSSLLRSVGYDIASSILEVEFLDGGRVYEYFDVPLSIYQEFMDAPSLGAYFNDQIRDLYAHRLAE